MVETSASKTREGCRTVFFSIIATTSECKQIIITQNAVTYSRFKLRAVPDTTLVEVNFDDPKWEQMRSKWFEETRPARGPHAPQTAKRLARKTEFLLDTIKFEVPPPSGVRSHAHTAPSGDLHSANSRGRKNWNDNGRPMPASKQLCKNVKKSPLTQTLRPPPQKHKHQSSKATLLLTSTMPK